MGGGELQLALAGGQMDEYLNKGIEPKTTYFKTVYKKYHNFSQESIELFFDKNTININNETVLMCKIERHGQLMQNVTCQIHIPMLKLHIDNAELYQCKWVNNLGPSLLKTAELIVGGQIIQTITGEWLHLYNQLYRTNKENVAQENMYSMETVEVDHSLKDKISSSNTIITSNEKSIYLDLPFCSMNSNLAIPLIALQYTEVSVRITLRPINDVILIRKRL